LIANFEAIATYLTKEPLAQRLSTLRIRIDHGIKEELIDLMERLHRPISRNKARILYDVGYTNYDILLTTPIMDIFKKTGISIRTLAEMIQNTTPIPPSLPATMDSYLEKSQS
jgi:replicative superfamily II helicase